MRLTIGWLRSLAVALLLLVILDLAQAWALPALGYWTPREALASLFNPCTRLTTAVRFSPDGKKIAEAFYDRCGDLIVPTVTLQPSATPAGDDSQDFVFAAQAPGALDISWQGNDVLQIHYSGRTDEVILRESRWQDVTLHYQP
jgi:hypothetical protein